MVESAHLRKLHRASPFWRLYPSRLTEVLVVLLSGDGQGRAPAHRDVPEPQAGGESVMLPR